MPEKLDRCVKHVMDQGKDKSSAFAICNKSLGLSSLSKSAMKHEWTDVNEFPAYEIHPKDGIRKKGKEKGLKGRNWLGYPKVTLMRDGKKHEKRIHKLVAEHFLPNPDRKPIVNHRDSDRSNHSIDNLEWVDNSGNQLHRWKTQKSGLAKVKYEKEYGLAKVARSKPIATESVQCKGLAPKDGGGRWGVGCKMETRSKKFFVTTHRARSKGYNSLSEIPKSKIQFVESTG